MHYLHTWNCRHLQMCLWFIRFVLLIYISQHLKRLTKINYVHLYNEDYRVLFYIDYWISVPQYYKTPPKKHKAMFISFLSLFHCFHLCFNLLYFVSIKNIHICRCTNVKKQHLNQCEVMSSLQILWHFNKSQKN